MQKLYDLIYQLSRLLKNKFGYALTIQQAKYAAYAAFLVTMWTVFAALIKGVYAYLGTLSHGFAQPVLLFFPSASVVSAVLTMYLSALVTKKVYAYMHDAWKSWMNNNAM
jgi:hypothetical protein